jgi:hypothetical protein
MEGELDARTDIESLADFFESTLAGIRIAAKAGKTRPALRRIAEVASGGLPMLNHRSCEVLGLYVERPPEITQPRAVLQRALQIQP